MRQRALLFSVFILLNSLAWTQTNPKVRPISNPEQRTSAYYESIRKQPSLLLAFVRALPKGADLHSHLSGAIYAEKYIVWAAEDGLCINRQTFAFATAPCDAATGTVPAKLALQNGGLYQQTVNALSMRQFNGPESGHDHFFAAFGKFGAVSRTRQSDMLADVASRAADQHISMLALLLSADAGEGSRFVTEHNIKLTDDFASVRKTLLEAGVSNVVAASRRNLDKYEAGMREALKCDTPAADPGCNVIIRYQYQIPRGAPPEQVFTQMVIGLELASADDRVLNINPVMPEDAYIPIRDFNLHMRMLDYLKTQYPNVKTSLHAGELAMGLVPPQDLRHHIRDSITLGHADRIGHGVSVMYENDPIALLKEMAAKKVAVEINLSSNDLILGVRGDDHPFPVYLKFGVPVVITTDDEGVSRSDLTHEYMRALRNYNVTYPQLKKIVRNSLEYSFLKGDSLFSSFTAGTRVPACARDSAAGTKLSPACEKFLGSSERAKAQWKLESDFVNFESATCCTATVH